jgi:CDP-glucose 4,6-dehydratase
VDVTLEEELRTAYSGKRVLVTGHTGFKGSWLTAWLNELGAEVTGYALEPEEPSLFLALGLSASCEHVIADVRDAAKLRTVMRASRPDFVFHLAAQALVRRSYDEPLLTLETNVMGTAGVLDAIRMEKLRTHVVVVTSDKCYENREWLYGYREDEPMGGHDPYSMSKGAAELVVASYRRSFFDPRASSEHGVYVASARAGNVIGGGDWAKDRIIPDMIRALLSGSPLVVRNPDSVRPWQHVLEPLGGYLLLAARLARGDSASRASFCEAFNFGPQLEAARPVRDLADALVAGFGEGSWKDGHDPRAPHEAQLLRLSIEKAHVRLGWRPRWGFDETIARTVALYDAHRKGARGEDLHALVRGQIAAYVAAPR